MQVRQGQRFGVRHWQQPNQTIEGVLAKFEALECKYLVGQIEGVEGEKWHLQGYVEFNERMTLKKLKPLLWNSTEWINANGNVESNFEYVTKDWDNPKFTGKICRLKGTEIVTKGTPLKQGKRNDLEDIKAMIDAGMNMKDVADEHFGSYVRYHAGFDKYARLKQKKDRGKPTVLIFWGKSGTGKSVMARNLAPVEDDDVYWLSQPHSRNSPLWWDGYEGQSTVVIDEFYGWMRYNLFLRLIDYGGMRVENKGGSVPMTATTFIFTSNEPPNEWYNLHDMPMGGEPFMRRLDDFATITETDDEFLQMALNWNEAQVATDVANQEC